MRVIKFSKALSILDKLLEGKKPKEIIYELEVAPSDISSVRNMFPLFTGLPHKYKQED